MGFTDHLELVGPDRTGNAAVVVMALVHNERRLLDPFLAHYRAMGDVTFLIVDDRSDDGGSDFLAAQPDVTVLRPLPGSTYAADKREWRGQALDRVAAGRWVLAPDIDELLVWPGYPERPLSDLIATLEAEGANALYAVMVDMYADKPLGAHVYEDGALTDIFPWFDCPRLDPVSTWMERGPSRFLRNWPTPEMHVLGGMRQRLFGGTQAGPVTRLGRRHAPAWNHRPDATRRRLASIWRNLTRARGPLAPLNLTKVPLLRWMPGTRFYGGAHAVRPAYDLGRERAALLHFPVTKGAEGLGYVAKRGQHAGGSVYYTRLLAQMERSPRYHGSRRYQSVADLDGIFAPEGENK